MPPSTLNMDFRRIENLNDDNTGRIFFYLKPVDLWAKRYRRFLFPDALPNSMLPREFFIIPRWFPRDVEEAVELCVDATVSILAEWEKKREKDRLKPEKKRPWSNKYTRDPTNDDAREKVGEMGVMEAFRFVKPLVEKYASIEPMETSKFGPSPYYDQYSAVAIFIVKEMAHKGFKYIRERLMENNVDLRISDKAKNLVPSVTRLKELYRNKRVRKWMRGFLRLLNSSLGAPIVKYLGAEREECVVDGTKVTTRYLNVVVIGLKKTLKRQTFTVKFLVDINTNMPVGATVSESHQVTDFIDELPENSTLYGDSEFFAEKNCEKALARGIDFQVKPRKSVNGGPAIKEVKSKFDPKKYRRRKNGERGAKPYSNDSRLKTRFKGREAWETLALSIALAEACKRLRVLKTKKKLFKAVVIRRKS